jgi:two-component system, OmpR family, response regulator
VRVLVVDDDKSIRAVIRAAMEGMEVVEAAGGADALAVLQNERIDVVILDVMMPRMNGFQVLAQIRRNPQLRAVPVVILSAKAAESDHVRGFRGGADGYVTKPFDVDELVALVQEVATRTPTERDRIREQELGKAELLRQIEHSFDG